MNVVPRWEWRAFGDSFPDAETRLASGSPPRIEESDEVYLVSLRNDSSVKLRDGRIDGKRLLRVNDDGLEQWEPVLKARLPVSAGEARAALELLGVEAAVPAHASYTLEELTSTSPELLAVPVHKRRAHYAFGGCMAELTELRADAGVTRTIAVESEDPARVIDAVRALGLESLEVVCVARGLKRLTGRAGRRFAVIDVGTNSVKFHLAEVQADGKWRTILDRAEVTRLGEGLDRTGELGDAPIERTADAVARMAAQAGRHGAETVAAVGTAALRIATNAGRFADAVKRRSDVDVVIIPAEEEARLAFAGATSGLDLAAERLVVFDTGGGSTQFTSVRADRVEERFSLPVGAVALTERFGLDGPVSADVVDAALAAIAGELARLDGRPAPDVVVGMGGAVTNLAAVRHRLVEYDPEIVQGTVLDRAEIQRQIELYRTRSAEERRGLPGLQPARAEVILAGSCIVLSVLDTLRRDALIVSDRGLRHGVLLERFGGRS